jgi:hypothetical protein
MNWVDWFIIIFLAVGFYEGMRKGFIVTVYNLVSVIIAMIATRIFYKDFSIILMNFTPIEKWVEKFLFGKNIFKGLANDIIYETMKFPAVQSQMTDLRSFMIMAVTNVISMFILFFLIRSILAISEAFLNGFSHLPGLREINSLGGGALGLVKSIIILFIAFAFLIPITAMGAWASVGAGIQGSTLAKYFYEYNFILGWIWDTALELIK